MSDCEGDERRKRLAHFIRRTFFQTPLAEEPQRPVSPGYSDSDVSKSSSSRKRSATSDYEQNFFTPAQRPKLDSGEETETASSSEEDFLDDQHPTRSNDNRVVGRGGKRRRPISPAEAPEPKVRRTEEEEVAEPPEVDVEVEVELVNVYCFCAECLAPQPGRRRRCPDCGADAGRRHWVVGRQVGEVLRRALHQGTLQPSQPADQVELLVSVEGRGVEGRQSTSSLVIDVLNNARPLVRIVAAIMHSPADAGEQQHPQEEVEDLLLSPWLEQMQKLTNEGGVVWRRSCDGATMRTAVQVVSAVSTTALRCDCCPYCPDTIGHLDGTWLSRIPRFNIPHSLSPDFGRLLLSVGVHLMLDSDDHLLTDLKWRDRMQVHQELSTALVPPFACTPDLMEGVEKWSSGQMLDWVLHLSIPCLMDKWPAEKLQHWACLVQAVHLLSAPQVSEQQLQIVRRCVHTFLLHVPRFYPHHHHLPLPLHMLSHLADATRRLGPLWATASNRFHHTHQIIQAAAEKQGEEGLQSALGMCTLLARVDELVEQHLKVPTPSPTLLGSPLSRSSLVFDSMLDFEAKYFREAAYGGVAYSGEGGKCTTFVTLEGGAVARVLHFALSRGNALAVCRKVRLRRGRRFPSLLADQQVEHLWSFEELPQFFECPLHRLRQHLYCVNGFLSAAPHPALRHYYHNDAPL